MFDSIYYKNKFVVTNKDGINTLYELILRLDGDEFFKHTISDDGEFETYLMNQVRMKPILDKNKVTPLKIFLIDNGYTRNDFINPFGRTNRIVSEIDKINTKVVNQRTQKNHIKSRIKRIK